MEGDAELGDIGIVLGTAAALTAVFAPLTTRLYRSRA
jgi:ABC-2 type transport system permease protein